MVFFGRVSFLIVFCFLLLVLFGRMTFLIVFCCPALVLFEMGISNTILVIVSR